MLVLTAIQPILVKALTAAVTSRHVSVKACRDYTERSGQCIC